MLETVPAFVAINVEVAASRKLATLQRDLQLAASAPPIKPAWVSPNNLRIAVRNLGKVDPSLAPGILDPLRELVAALPPIRVQVGPLAAFPSPSNARLILVQVVESTGLLADLCTRIDAQLAELGLAPANQPFHPHITLARLESVTDVDSWISAVTAVSFEARLTEVAFYLHLQRRPGAEHVSVDRFPLAPPLRVSQRPSKAPKQPSHRPSKRPKGDPNSVRPDAIPAPPRLPSIPLPGPQPPAPVAAQAEKPRDSKDGRSSSSILPPAVQAALPPDDEWGM